MYYSSDYKNIHNDTYIRTVKQIKSWRLLWRGKNNFRFIYTNSKHNTPEQDKNK